MELEDFVKNFSSQLEDIDPSEINAETVFRDIVGWSSFTALAIIAMIDEIYHASISGDDIRKSNTILDIFNIVKSRIK